MSGFVITDTGCGALRLLRPESLQSGRIQRFVAGGHTRVSAIGGLLKTAVVATAPLRARSAGIGFACTPGSAR